MLLTAAYESRTLVALLIEVNRGSLQAQFSIVETVVFHTRVTQINPLIAKPARFKCSSYCGFSLRLLWQRWHIHFYIDSPVSVNHRPGILIPTNRSQKHFPAKIMMEIIISKRKAHYPPATIGSLNQIGVTYALNRITLRILVDVRQDRIGRIASIRPIDAAAAGDSHLMPIFCSSFRNKQIIPPVFFINMRSLGIPTTRAVPNASRFSQLFSCFRVYLTQIYTIRRIAYQVALSIFKIKRRVYSSLLQPYWFRPFSIRIGGIYNEITLVRHIGGCHVESSFMVTNGRGIYSLRGVCIVQRQLRLARQTMPYLLPMRQIPAVEQWHTWKILETTGYQIIIIAYAANARIGMESRNYWILIPL